MSGRSTRVKAVLGSVGLLIATASAATVSNAGGTLVANYSQIGVVIARSSDPNFAATVQQNGNVGGAARTDGFATKVSDGMDTSGPVAAPIPAPGSDPLSGL